MKKKLIITFLLIITLITTLFCLKINNKPHNSLHNYKHSFKFINDNKHIYINSISDSQINSLPLEAFIILTSNQQQFINTWKESIYYMFIPDFITHVKQGNTIYLNTVLGNCSTVNNICNVSFSGYIKQPDNRIKQIKDSWLLNNRLYPEGMLALGDSSFKITTTSNYPIGNYEIFFTIHDHNSGIKTNITRQFILEK